MKRGLKGKFGFSNTVAISVEETSPMKRGLKVHVKSDRNAASARDALRRCAQIVPVSIKGATTFGFGICYFGEVTVSRAVPKLCPPAQKVFAG